MEKVEVLVVKAWYASPMAPVKNKVGTYQTWNEKPKHGSNIIQFQIYHLIFIFLKTNFADDNDKDKDDGPTAEQCQKFIEEACPEETEETGIMKILKLLLVIHHW